MAWSNTLPGEFDASFAQRLTQGPLGQEADSTRQPALWDSSFFTSERPSFVRQTPFLPSANNQPQLTANSTAASAVLLIKRETLELVRVCFFGCGGVASISHSTPRLFPGLA
jgi:hypothetical protein